MTTTNELRSGSSTGRVLKKLYDTRRNRFNSEIHTRWVESKRVPYPIYESWERILQFAYSPILYPPGVGRLEPEDSVNLRTLISRMQLTEFEVLIPELMARLVHRYALSVQEDICNLPFSVRYVDNLITFSDALWNTWIEQGTIEVAGRYALCLIPAECHEPYAFERYQRAILTPFHILLGLRQATSPNPFESAFKEV